MLKWMCGIQQKASLEENRFKVKHITRDINYLYKFNLGDNSRCKGCGAEEDDAKLSSYARRPKK